MKSKLFGNFLDSYSSQILAFGRETESVGVRALAGLFKEQPENATTAQVLKKVDKLQLKPGRVGGPIVGDFLAATRLLNQDFVKYIAATAMKDLRTLETALAKLHDIQIEDIVARVREQANSQTTTVRSEIVDDYVERLEKALGRDDQFEKLIQQLDAKIDVSVAELKKIAAKFHGKSVKTEAEAIRRIRSRQNNLVDQRKRDAATAGRTAA